MTEMHDDARIFEDMSGPLSREDLEKTALLMEGWAKVTEDQNATVRTVFLACVHAILTAGPAYCKIAAVNLMKAAVENVKDS